MSNDLKEYSISELGALLWASADRFVAGGNINNSELQNVAIPTVFLKRTLDLREDYINKQLVQTPSYEMSEDYVEAMKSEITEINQAFQVVNKDEWFFVTYDDIINFTNENIDGNEIEITLAIGDIKLKTNAKDRIDFIHQIYKNILNPVVKSIFHESRYFEHYLNDRRKLSVSDVDGLFNSFAGEFFGDNVSVDMFSTAYIYIISKFAAGAGKKAGEFFTPDAICKMVIGCLDPKLNPMGKTKVCDLTSGAATFLIELGNHVASESGMKDVKNKLEFYLQEVVGQTLVLGEAGLLLSGFEHLTAYHADTLLNYKENIGKNKGEMDYFVGNPPYGTDVLKKDVYEKIGELKEEERWEYGLPPRAQIEWFFVQTAIDMLKEDGKGALVLPLGSLFKKNSKTMMIDEDIIEGLILLPGNMFQSTQIPTCVIFFNKNKSEEQKDNIFMINTTDTAFKKDKYNSIDYEKIMHTYKNRIVEKDFSDVVPLELIKENDYNLSVQRYVFTDIPEEVIDIEAVLLETSKLEEKILENKAVMGNVFSQILNLKG